MVEADSALLYTPVKSKMSKMNDSKYPVEPLTTSSDTEQHLTCGCTFSFVLFQLSTAGGSNVQIKQSRKSLKARRRRLRAHGKVNIPGFKIRAVTNDYCHC